jgi:hypothetical protein
MTRDPLEVLLDAASRQLAPAREPNVLDAAVDRAVLVARARHERANRMRWLAAAAACLLVAAGGGAAWLRPSPRIEASASAAAVASPIEGAQALSRWTLPTGDDLVTNEAAVLRASSLGAERRFVLEEGAVLFDVRALGADGAFTVEAGAAVVRVRGTVFLVRRQDDEVHVRVFEGRVEVTDESGTRALGPGESFQSGHLVPDSASIRALDREGRRRAGDRERLAASVAVDPPGEVERERAATRRAERAPARALEGRPSLEALRRMLVEARFAEILAGLGGDPRLGAEVEIDLIRADALRGAGRTSDAIAAYGDASGRLSPSRAAEIGYLAAQLAFVQRDPAGSVALLERTHADRDGSPVEERATALRARAERALGDDAASATAYRYLVRFPGGNAREEMEHIASGE